MSTEGISILNSTFALGPNAHESLFMSDLFGQSSLVDGHVGTLGITSTAPVAVVTLRFAGDLFTSVPTFAYAAGNWYRPA